MKETVKSLEKIFSSEKIETIFVPILIAKKVKSYVHSSIVVLKPSRLLYLIRRYRYIYPISESKIVDMVNKVVSANVNENKPDIMRKLMGL